jgi:uncharacterized protein (TIGR03437 family)
VIRHLGSRKVLAAKFAAVLTVPVVLWAYPYGAQPRMSGAPGDSTCNQSRCHVGTPLNGGSGNVKIDFASNPPTYVPGQKQTFTITITDAAARFYGFQVSARAMSDSTNTGAGDFTPSQPAQWVECVNGTEKVGTSCGGNNLQFINQATPLRTNVISVDWTAPATDIGPVGIYVAANAANGNGNESGDHIYTASYTLKVAGSAPKPLVSQGGAVAASAFGGGNTISPGAFLEIYGQNLSTDTADWSSSFQGTTAPINLRGVTVSVGGKPAFVSYVSPGQVNVQVPDNIGTGTVNVVVTNANGSSDPVTVQSAQVSPGILAPFNVNGKQYVAAFQQSTILGSPGHNPVKPGDVITLYGLGFGPTNPAVPAGQISTGMAKLTGTVDITLGNTPIPVTQNDYFGLAPNFAGVYQFNITVPNVPAGEYQLKVRLNGQALAQQPFNIVVGQ